MMSMMSMMSMIVVTLLVVTTSSRRFLRRITWRCLTNNFRNGGLRRRLPPKMDQIFVFCSPALGTARAIIVTVKASKNAGTAGNCELYHIFYQTGPCRIVTIEPFRNRTCCTVKWYCSWASGWTPCSGFIAGNCHGGYIAIAGLLWNAFSFSFSSWATKLAVLAKVSEG